MSNLSYGKRKVGRPTFSAGTQPAEFYEKEKSGTSHPRSLLSNLLRPAFFFLKRYMLNYNLDSGLSFWNV